MAIADLKSGILSDHCSGKGIVFTLLYIFGKKTVKIPVAKMINRRTFNLFLNKATDMIENRIANQAILEALRTKQEYNKIEAINEEIFINLFFEKRNTVKLKAVKTET